VLVEVDVAETETEAIDLTLLEPVLAERAGMDGSLIPILQKTQDIYGYLPAEALAEISRATRIPLSKVYGVVTFYAQFSLVPKGKHTVRVCRGTACHVRGGKSVLTTAKRVLGVGDGETTEDMMFTLETVACLGACALAPVAVVDGTYYGKVTAQRMEQIIGRTRSEG
jgi:NADH-quinone oxidoreductase subunit E